MNYANIKYCDIANGQGVRTSLFVSGCTHRCPGCFNEVAWDFSYGDPFDDAVADAVMESLEPSYIAGLTVLGGEPMEPANQAVLAPFLKKVKEAFPQKDVWVYTGDVYEELVDPANPRHTRWTDPMLDCIDVLVDGPFVEDLKDITLRFKGSQNQRVLDVARTREAGRAMPWEDDPVFAQHSMGRQDLHL